jgi:Spy/CpxP family protein refolding chaperone
MKPKLIRFFLISGLSVLILSGSAISKDKPGGPGKGDMPKNGAPPYMKPGMSKMMKGGPGMGGGMMGVRMEVEPRIAGTKDFEIIGRLLNELVFVKDLQLSETQIQKLKKLRTNSLKEQIKNKADLDILQLELEELLDQDTPNIKEIDTELDAIGKKQTEMQKEFLHSILDTKSVLNKEQLENLRKISLRDRMPPMMRNDGPGMGPETGMGPEPPSPFFK